MGSSPVTRTVTVANHDGLHLRAATLIAELVRGYRAEVKVVKGSDRVNATDVLQVVSLATHAGETLLLEATGEEAEAALDGLARLFANRFENEAPRGKRQPQGGLPSRDP